MIGDQRVVERIRAAAAALGVRLEGPRTISKSLDGVAAATDPSDLAVAYVVLGALRAAVPPMEHVIDFSRRWILNGLREAARPELMTARRVRTPFAVSCETMVDLTDTASSSYVTGIQRVSRETTARWSDRIELSVVAWRRGRLHRVDREGRVGASLLPFGATFVLPEIATDRVRAGLIASIATTSRSRALAIGHDAIPMTTAETAGIGMPAAFARYLAALSHFDVVASVSRASGVEYAGWRRMLAGVGIAGPRLETVPLPIAAPPENARSAADALAGIGLDGSEPVVLIVGSHEPRKNHLRLLEACELVWRTGETFSLVMVGGNAWRTGPFDRMVADLRRRGRRIVLPRGVGDDALWGLYRAAAFTLFCSLNEGYGLPVAESISVGTPVVTADFGSQAEIGAGRGAVLVDPRDVDAIAAAALSMLTDADERERLAAEARSSPTGDWDTYADDLLKVFGIGLGIDDRRTTDRGRR